MVKQWLARIVGLAPIGPTESLVLVVTGGGTVLALGLGISPKATDPLWPWWVLWWIVLAAGVALFLRGLWGLLVWALGLTGRSVQFVRERASSLPRIRVVVERPKQVSTTAEPFVDFLDRPDAPLSIKIYAVFAGLNASRQARARVKARTELRKSLQREPTAGELDEVARVLYERNDTTIDVSEDEARAYFEAGGNISTTLLPWNANTPTASSVREASIGGLEIVSPVVEASESPPPVPDNPEPPDDWKASFYKGHEIFKCYWCDFRTTNREKLNQHLDVHTDPPLPQNTREVNEVPRQYAKTPIHYLGDGSQYMSGVPADRAKTFYVTENYADELAATGLYELGPRPDEVHALASNGPPLKCKCGHEAPNTAWFQSHLHENGIGR